jgi:hypothetical protein
MRTAFTDLVGVPHPIAGFNRSPGVVAAVTNAGGLGVLAASAYTPEELDAQLTWIEDQVGGKPYGVDLLVPEKFVPGDPDDLIASLRAQIPEQHLAFVRGLLDQYGIPEEAALEDNSGIVAGLSPGGGRAGPRRGRRVVRVGLAGQRRGRGHPGHQGQVPARGQLGHAALADPHRQAGPAAAQRLARRMGPAGRARTAADAAAANAGRRRLAAHRPGRRGRP